MKKELFANILSPLETAVQPYLDRMNDAFEKLGKRDQLMVIILGFIFSVFVLYSIVWAPISTSVENAKKSYQEEYALLSWMKAQEANVLEGRKNPGNKRSVGNESLLALVNNKAQHFSLPLKRYEPDGDNKLRVWLESVPFDTVMLWMNTLSVNKGLSISSVSIDAEQGRGGESKKGVVSVKVVFEK